jgi:asparagine synthase (glutamine-hydrolysing)
MCGIAGYVGPAPPGLLPGMLDLIHHRGPDDLGRHEAGGAGVGVTRLAIIDLATGRQPIATDDGAAHVVFNGEIYNFRALRAALEARGCRFRTSSDTEVLLRAWETHGEACVDDLRGMFAFAIWDARRRRLFAARDRLGKKPFYYWHRDGLFLFASEVKQLLRHPAVGRDLDWAALHHYLAFGYVPGDRSIFAEIHNLPAGHTLTLEDGRVAVRRYWALPAAATLAPRPGDPREAAARVRESLREAVRLRLESDVPLGVFLSGGIDSGTIVATMRSLVSGPIRTFTIGFASAPASYVELPLARRLAERFETTHHEETLEPKLADLLPTIVRHLDEPFADSSALPTFVVAQATARHVKVALSGVGGDEAFGGYPRYLGVRAATRWARASRWARALGGRRLLGLLPRDGVAGDWRNRVERFLGAAATPMPGPYLEWTRFFGDGALGRLATPALRERLTADVEATRRAAWASHAHDDPMDGAFRIDLATYLPDDLLVMADRMSMAHSLELRAPFCDHRLLEEALAIPPAVKVPGWRLKGLLRAAFADTLPPETLAARKQGFMVPLGRWLRAELQPLVEDLLDDARVRARGLFEPAAVAALRREHLAGAGAHADRLWTLMMLELWMRERLDGPVPWALGGGAPARAAGPRARRGAAGRADGMRVLVVADVSPLAIIGGGERALHHLSAGLAARGHRVTVLARAPEGGAPAETTVAGLRVLHFSSTRRSPLAYLVTSVLGARRAAARALGREGADVYHVHQPLSGLGLLGSRAGRAAPSLYTFHSSAPLEYRSRARRAGLRRLGPGHLAAIAGLRLIERRCLGRASRIHALSRFSADLLGQLHGIAPDRVAIIPGGADLERFRPAPDRAAVRARLGLPADRPLVLTVRNLEPRMGLDVLVEAVPGLVARVADALVVIAGAGPLRAELEARVAALGLGPHVRFTGWVPEADLPGYYQAADLFVLPTRELEGFGLVTVEALAAGTPVVGTAVGATPEILAPLDPRLVVAEVTPAALGAGCGDLLRAFRADPEAARRLRAACRRHAETRYAWPTAVARVEAELEALVASVARAAGRAAGA